jgi:hypothetical protein
MFDCNLLKKAALFRLACPCWGNTRKGTMSREAAATLIGRRVGEDDQQFEDRLTKAMRLLGITKQLVDVPEFAKLQKYLSGVRTDVLDQYANPSFIMDGLYSVKLEIIPRAISAMEAYKSTLRPEYVNPFLRVFERAVLETKSVLNGQFRPADYPGASLDAAGNLVFDPEVLAARFNVDWQFVTFSVPDGLSPELREEEERKLKARYTEAEQKITALLYTGFQRVASNMVDRLKPGADGKAKTFQYTLVENALDFIKSFRAKNTFDDQQLAAMVAKAEEILQAVGDGKDPEAMAKRLRDYEGMRSRTAAAFEAVKAEVDKAVQDLPLRSVTFTED